MRIDPKSEVRNPKPARRLGWVFVAAGICRIALGAEPLMGLVSDRAAVERVYYSHRLGDKPPFEQALPRETLEHLVRDDLRKEAVLKRVYGVEITPAMIEGEVQRINATTRAPDMLAELKSALGNDPARFGWTVARPIVVERLLRERFDNDDALHAAQRERTDAVRNRLLAQPHTEQSPRWERLKEWEKASTHEVTWQLTPRPAEEAKLAAPSSGPGAKTQGQGRSRNYALETSAQVVQVLSSPPAGREEPKFYFEDLPPRMREVLAAQLRQPGDVSAVLETPREFLLMVAKERTAMALSVVSLSVPKRDYEGWLAEQPAGEP